MLTFPRDFGYSLEIGNLLITDLSLKKSSMRGKKCQIRGDNNSQTGTMKQSQVVLPLETLQVLFILSLEVLFLVSRRRLSLLIGFGFSLRLKSHSLQIEKTTALRVY